MSYGAEFSGEELVAEIDTDRVPPLGKTEVRRRSNTPGKIGRSSVGGGATPRGRSGRGTG
jgi:hypothetical protein